MPITDAEIRNVISVHGGDRAIGEILGGLLDRIQAIQRHVGLLDGKDD